MRFYLGTPEPHWLGRSPVPWFVSLVRLQKSVGPGSRLRALGPWALDSGAFTEISTYHRWRIDAPTYAGLVNRYAAQLGGLEWAAPQDWMVEPFILEKTGKTVTEHQRLTTENFLELRELPTLAPIIPVLQGWEFGDYWDHIGMYEDAGVDLTKERLVGVGSICRRQASEEIEAIMRELADYSDGLNLHGFGVKLQGLRRYAEALSSADSMAWSYNARRNPPLPGCDHKHCNNCLRFALHWRRRALASLV